MTRKWLILPLFLLVALPTAGCRRAVPPSFSPSPEVVELTAELLEEEDTDPEELEVYEALQADIATQLRQLAGTPTKAILLGQEKNSDKLKHGYALYAKYCTQCHGINGDGNGPVAEHLNPKPRNYTYGIFKFTSTPYGSKPRRSDLAKTIEQGVTGTSMPSFDRLSEVEVDAVIEYVLMLTYRGQLERELASYASEDEELPDEEGLAGLIEGILTPWADSADLLVMPATPMPRMTDETVRAGHEMFMHQACNKCHGKFGRGGSMGNVEIGKDAWGNSAAAADLSSGMFHGGGRPIDIYRRISSGINGTPMPAFKRAFAENPDVIWHLVHFIKATGNRRRQGLPPLSEADLPTAESADLETPSADDNEEEANPKETEDDEDEEMDAEEESETETELEPAEAA